MRGALEQVKRGFRNGDLIVVWKTKQLYQYYAGELTSLGAPMRILGRPGQVASLMEMVETKGYRRLWFVAADRPKLTKSVIREIIKRGPIRFEWRANRTIVLLFEFKGS
jgi:hypothetical protein